MLAEGPNLSGALLTPPLQHHVGQVHGDLLDVLDVVQGPAWGHHVLLNCLAELVPGLALEKILNPNTNLDIYQTPEISSPCPHERSPGNRPPASAR